MERHIAALTSAQRALGVEVVSIHNSGLASGDAIRVASAVNLSRIRPDPLKKFIFYLGAALAANRIPANRKSFLHVHGDWSDALFSTWLAARAKTVGTALTIHGSLKADARKYRFAFSRCEPIFATGKAEQIYLEEVLQRPIVHMPSAPAEYFFQNSGASSDPMCDVICVSNLYQVKRVDLIIDCALLLPHRKFSVFGDGPMRTQLQNRILNSCAKNVELLGSRSATEIARAMHSARVFLSTAEHEGTPTAALEAMACGLPVVLTPSNNYEWLIQNGKNGIATKTWNPDEIASSIEECILDEGRRIEMSVHCREAASTHKWSEKARLVSRLMSDVVESRS